MCSIAIDKVVYNPALSARPNETPLYRVWGVTAVRDRAALKKAYDAHFLSEYNALKVKRYTMKVDCLIEDGYNAIEELAGEMEEAAENTPDSLKGGDVGQRRQEAADALSNLQDKPDIPAVCENLDAVFFPHRDAKSRPKRAAEAADMLTTAAGAIREYLDAEPEDGKEVENADELSDLADKLEEDAAELEGVDFPGMYG